MNFVFNVMDFALKMMDFVLNMMDFAFKMMMDFVFNMMILMQTDRCGRCSAPSRTGVLPPRPVSR